MTIFLIILSIFLLILLFLLFVKLNFKFIIEYGFNNENFVKLRFYVIHPVLGINIKLNNKENEEKETKKEEIKDEEKEKTSFIEKAKDVKKNFDIIKDTFSNSKQSIKKTINIKKLDLNIDFGLSDAALTGISTGVLWASVYSVFSVLTKIVTVHKHNFKIDPIFNKTVFTVKCDGIIYARLVNIISAGFMLLKNYNKAKNKI
ncbi:MAG: DUF2953 domain-containing protein [Ruminococcaceae bacterium]|nr:DUF2953 domain-containing protein [Oscillospiraceae bacterium]